MSEPLSRPGIPRRHVPGCVLALLCAASATICAAGTAPATRICDAAAHHAARETGVPRAILETITRVETGRTMSGVMTPWPWAVNMAGRGYWFDDREAAIAYARRHRDAGARGFDIGCFQINYRWHGAAFPSLDRMFDPYANALYAARFLKSLHDETGNWAAAVGFYHSRSPDLSRAYRTRFDRIRATLRAPSGAKPPATAPHDRIRVTSGSVFPLPVSAETAERGTADYRHGALALNFDSRASRSGGM